MEVEMMASMVKTYSELITLPSFEERFEYLKENGSVGEDTFGYNRYMNQAFYQSREWHNVRNRIIARDMGCDLGMPDHPIGGKNIYVHHINPLTPNDIETGSPRMFDPENLICVSFDTHNAIHYGDSKYLKLNKISDRKPGDTCPWK